MDWTTKWREAAAQVGFDLKRMQPVELELGFVCDPEKLAFEWPIFWLDRNKLDAGLLEIHKRFLVSGRLPFFASYLNSGAAHTLTCLEAVTGAEGCAADYIDLLTDASFKEFSEWTEEFRQWSRRDFAQNMYVHRDAIEHAIRSRGAGYWGWHYRSRRLGPDHFISSDDFEAELGPPPSRPRPVSFDAFARIIVRGHKRLFDAFALVRPKYLKGAPPSVQSELDVWLAERKAEQQEQEKRWRGKREAVRREEQRKAEEADRKRRHLLAPRDRDQTFPERCWAYVTKEELCEALDGFPMTHLAVMYGVSEAAIRKRMKKWGLKGKRQGYWLRGVRPSSATR